MAQWGKNDVVSNAVSWVAQSLSKGSGHAAIAANNAALYGNTTPGAFVDGLAVGVFAVSKEEMANTQGEGRLVSTPGWHLRTAWTGPIVGATVTAGGSGYANGDTIEWGNGSSNAVGVIVTNGTGNVASVDVTAGGGGWLKTAQVNSTVTTAGGTGATITPVLGGRAGRVHYQTLVAMDIVGDGSDDAILPE